MNNDKDWFSEAEYAKILDNLVIVCVDTLIYDADNNLLLGKRNKFPIKDWWIFGGRMNASENFFGASKRGIQRELGLEVKGEPEFIGYYDLVWSLREERPQNNGCHLLLAAMKYKLSDREASLVLRAKDHNEIKWFNYDDICNLKTNSLIKTIITDSGIYASRARASDNHPDFFPSHKVKNPEEIIYLS